MMKALDFHCPRCGAVPSQPCRQVIAPHGEKARPHAQRSTLVPVPVCGTYGGFQRHERKGEDPCDSCRDARNAYMRDYRYRNERAQAEQTRRINARARAALRVAKEHPETFEQYITEEMAS